MSLSFLWAQLLICEAICHPFCCSFMMDAIIGVGAKWMEWQAHGVIIQYEACNKHLCATWLIQDFMYEWSLCGLVRNRVTCWSTLMLFALVLHLGKSYFFYVHLQPVMNSLTLSMADMSTRSVLTSKRHKRRVTWLPVLGVWICPPCSHTCLP
jgi:hypothetical protein